MKIIQKEKVEDCLEAKNVYDFIVSDPLTKEDIEYLGKLGKLNYVSIFENPFFRIICRGKYTLKGSQNNQLIRILLPDNYDEKDLEDFIQYVENN